MRNILFFAVLLLLAGCTKEERINLTTYQVKNDCTTINSGFEYLDGSLWEVVVFCYNDKDEIVRQDNPAPISTAGGISPMKEVTKDIVKVKVSFKSLPPQSPYYELDSNIRRYVVTTFYLVEEENTVIVVDDNSMMSGNITLKSLADSLTP